MNFTWSYISHLWHLALSVPLLLAKSNTPLNEMDNEPVTFITPVMGCTLLLDTIFLSVQIIGLVTYLWVFLESVFKGSLTFAFHSFHCITEQFLIIKIRQVIYEPRN